MLEERRQESEFPAASRRAEWSIIVARSAVALETVALKVEVTDRVTVYAALRNFLPLVKGESETRMLTFGSNHSTPCRRLRGFACAVEHGQDESELKEKAN